jgi:hypothetical protein
MFLRHSEPLFVGTFGYLRGGGREGGGRERGGEGREEIASWWREEIASWWREEIASWWWEEIASWWCGPQCKVLELAFDTCAALSSAAIV